MKPSKKIVSDLLGHFMRGLLLIAPFALTIYIISFVLTWIDSLIGTKYPGLGIAILVSGITLFGYLTSNLLFKSLFELIEGLIKNVPLISTIYSSVKELTAAFVGQDKKFSKPVLVLINHETHLYKLGFITQKDLTNIKLPGSVAVYVPHSYNFSGDLFLLPTKYVTPVEAGSADVMRFIVSGGITGLAQHPGAPGAPRERTPQRLGPQTKYRPSQESFAETSQ